MKRLLICLLLLIASTCQAQEQLAWMGPIMAGGGVATSTPATTYWGYQADKSTPTTGYDWDPTYNFLNGHDYAYTAPASGTIVEMCVWAKTAGTVRMAVYTYDVNEAHTLVCDSGAITVSTAAAWYCTTTGFTGSCSVTASSQYQFIAGNNSAGSVLPCANSGTGTNGYSTTDYATGGYPATLDTSAWNSSAWRTVTIVGIQ